MPIRVLVVDDSILMRTKITEMVERDGDIKVVGTSSNGLDALDKIRALKPDVMTLDVQMPQLDGLSALKQLMEERPCRVIILTGHTVYGGEETVRALEMGAIDFVLKPSGSLSLDIERVEQELRAKIRLAMEVDLAHLASRAVPRAARGAFLGVAFRWVLVIGASTGGPRALSLLLPELATTMPATIIVVQHMPTQFTASFAGHLDSLVEWSVAEAQEGDALQSGRIYVAPGGRHLDLAKRGDRWVLLPLPSDAVKGPYIPSIDFTMKRAAELFGDRAIGILLTGMGDDGVAGMQAIRGKGGRTIAESEESAIIFGMPRVAAQRHAAEFVLPLSAIARRVAKFVQET